jgi:Zn-dependent hydrolases, including glyoxylases
MAEFPLAKLVVHPKGARHMVNPAKLEAGVVAVYGEKFVAEMYGKLSAIDVERIIVAEDSLEINLNGRSLICLDTPGHANHHNVIFDRKANVVFTGDIFGVAYPEFTLGNATFAFPATTPVNFDPQKMAQSIDLIVSLLPEAVYLTHFGRLTDIASVANDLKRMANDYVQIALDCVDDLDVVVAVKVKLQEYMLSETAKFGITYLSDERVLELLDMDLQINAQGLAVWLKSSGKLKQN